MEWNNGFSAAYYAYILDPVTWRETSKLRITGGKVNHQADGLRESAEINCIDYTSKSEQWIRIYLDARQGGDGIHVPVFTGLASSPSRDIDGLLTQNALQCYSVLKPAEDVFLDIGYYVLAGTDGASVIRDLLSVCPAPVIAPDSAPALMNTIVAEKGETRLTMTDKILEALGWQMVIGGDGALQIGPPPTTAVIKFDPIENDIIEPQITIKYDWYECPNVYRVTSGDLTAVARDDSPESPFSTINRGREIWKEEQSVNLSANEDIASYAHRKLKEAQAVALTASYNRRFRPDVAVGDLIELHYPKQGLDGPFRVTSQSVELGYGARTSEEVISL